MSNEYNFNEEFKDLKRTLRGKKSQYFLVNDTNSEIRQHYDKSYKGHLNLEKVKESIKSRKDYAKKGGMNYSFFVVPDKSIILRDCLPFKTSTPYRHVDSLTDVVCDLTPIITEDDTLSNDTHISQKSSIKIVSAILTHLHGKKRGYYEKQLESHTQLAGYEHKGDLFSYKNWSYERNEEFMKNSIIESEKVLLTDEYEEIDDIPEEFKYVSIRKSRHFRNRNSILDKKALILHGSTVEHLLNCFIASYREVFLYWDHGYFNRRLVDWFDADDIIELRIERKIENSHYPIINDEYTVEYPVHCKFTEFNVEDDSLRFVLDVKNLCQIGMNGSFKLYIDDKPVDEGTYTSPFKYEHSLEDYEYGDYTLKIELTDSYGRRHIIRKKFPYYESLTERLSDLKMTLRGKDNSFFRVHDRNNEILQHYDRMYRPRLDKKKFNESIKYKKSFCESLNIRYEVFSIADKSVVLKDYVPFEGKVRRFVDKLDGVHDLNDLLNVDDYLRNDTQLSSTSCVKLVAYMLSTLYPDESMDSYLKRISEHLDTVRSEHKGNLFTKNAWSYDESLKERYYSIEAEDAVVRDDYVCVDNDDIPVESREFSNIRSQYYKNDNAVLDRKAIILHDSSISPFLPSLITSFSEVFLYFDFWYFNKHILDWYDADVILEIREECSFENPLYPLVSMADEVVIPVNAKFERFDVADNTLFVDIHLADLKKMPVESEYTVYIDQEEATSGVLSRGLLSFEHDVTGYESGSHQLRIIVEKSRTTKRKVLERTFNIMRNEL